MRTSLATSAAGFTGARVFEFLLADDLEVIGGGSFRRPSADRGMAR